MCLPSYLRTFIHTQLYTYVYTCIHIHIYVYIHIYIYVHTIYIHNILCTGYLCAYLPTSLRTYKFNYIHTYTHAYIFIYMFIYIYKILRLAALRLVILFRLPHPEAKVKVSKGDRFYMEGVCVSCKCTSPAQHEFLLSAKAGVTMDEPTYYPVPKNYLTGRRGFWPLRLPSAMSLLTISEFM